MVRDKWAYVENVVLYLACEACLRNSGTCVQKDDMADGGKMRDKEFYFITTAANDPAAMELTMNDLQGYVDCIPGSVVKGRVYGQAFAVGEIKGKSAMDEAYALGRHS